MAAHALAILGITGRMGQSLIRAVRETAQFRLSGALASSSSPRLGMDAVAEGEPTGVTITADPALALHQAAVAVDFSVAGAVAAHVQACAAAKVPVLVGATGLDAATRDELGAAARRIPILLAPNTSVGVGVLAELVAQATQALGPAYDVEIAEAHHRHKRDAPSGTALFLGEIVATVRGRRLQEVANFDRQGPGPRAPGTIGFSVVREGDIVGEHTVSFATAGERLEITHRATSRAAFAQGALKAAAWLLDQPAGLYGMRDVIAVQKKHGQ